MGKINIVISPSQQIYNSCKAGDSECQHMRKIGQIVYNTLKTDSRLNVYMLPLIDKSFQKNNDYLEEIQRLSNAFINKYGGKGYHIALHSDAYKGQSRGTTTFCYKFGTRSHDMAKAIHKHVVSVSKVDRGISERPGLAEVGDGIVATSVLNEIDFHDNVEGAKFIHSNIEKFANAIVNGIYEGLGLKRPEPPKPKVKYVVQCGAFSDLKNAEELQNRLIKDGYNAIIKNI